MDSSFGMSISTKVIFFITITTLGTACVTVTPPVTEGVDANAGLDSAPPAVSGSDAATTPDSAPPDVTAPDATTSDSGTNECVAVCSSAATRCGAPADRIADGCNTLCSSVPTQAQLDCLAQSSCVDLAASFTRNETVCGIGQVSPDAGVQPPSACQVGDRQCLDDFTAFRCDLIAGRATSITEHCSTPCERGYCTNPRVGGAGSTCSDASGCRAPDLCVQAVCCTPASEICFEDSDCCDRSQRCRATSLGFKACQ